MQEPSEAKEPETPEAYPALALAVGGTVYRLRHRVEGGVKVWRFEHDQGPPGGYMVLPLGDTVVCSCPDYCFRRAGKREVCKHGEAALLTGLL